MRISDFRLQRSDSALPSGGVSRGQSEICNLKPEIPRRSRKGFTLIEILVVVTVIAILAGMTFGAMRMARRSACEAKTKATIAKLDHFIMLKYDSFQTRRVPLNLGTLTNDKLNLNAIATDLKLAARIRLDALRDLMRMEMPQNVNDVTNDPWKYTYKRADYPSLSSDLSNISVPRPALGQLYLNYYNANKPKNNDNLSAKCLYMIVTMGCPEARELFNQNEIATTSDDPAWPMFVDGWGDPIKFLRWAPGFNDSDIQPNIMPTTDWTSPTGKRQFFSQNDHDPFDPRGTDTTALDNWLNQQMPSGWRLRPLIFSAAGKKYTQRGKPNFGLPNYGILDGIDYTYSGTPYVAVKNPDDSSVNGLGAPDGTNNHFGNIHNHRIEAK
jgi:prepilin-type N-terminal cleavage/methylation domain-containing protein